MFLGSVETFSVIIASDLDKKQDSKLLIVLSEHKKATRWSLADIKEISPDVVMHRIHFEENAKISSEP